MLQFQEVDLEEPNVSANANNSIKTEPVDKPMKPMVHWKRLAIAIIISLIGIVVLLVLLNHSNQYNPEDINTPVNVTTEVEQTSTTEISKNSQ